MLKDLVVATPHQRTLEFLVQNPRCPFHVREIGRRLPDCSLTSIKLALKDLAGAGLVRRERVGRNIVNHLDKKAPIVKLYRILSNVLELHELVVGLEEMSVRVVLFGSRAEGTNDMESDFDLLVVSSNTSAVRALVHEHRLHGQIKAVILTPTEMLNLPRDDRGLHQEVQEGLVLWQKE